MIVGYSLSPGGLLFPYHIGVLQCLSKNGFLSDSNPIAGSSAGAIAVAAHSTNVRPDVLIDATIRISDQCLNYGSARGNLMPLLENELDNLLPQNAHEIISNREAIAGIAYKEIFPRFRNVLETNHDTREHLIDSVCSSAMFPFFTTNFPFRRAKNLDGKPGFRLTMDGYFTVDRSRFGCPDFAMPHARQSEAKNVIVDRTVTISVFPHDTISLSASGIEDQISPTSQENTVDQMSRLLRLATQCGTKDDYFQLYEEGWVDAERWIKKEERLRNSQRNDSNIQNNYSSMQYDVTSGLN